MLKLTLIVVVILGYFAMNAFLTVSVYDSYKAASDSLPVLAQRNVITTLLSTLLIESLDSADPTYLCVKVDGVESKFDKYYRIALDNEKSLLDYKKSSKPIFSDYKQAITSMDSDAFCSWTHNPERIFLFWRS